MSAPRRSTLAAWWAVFLVAWIVVAYLAFAMAGLGPCGGDGGSPYAAPASPAGRYCEAWDAYVDAGEPGELTSAVVWLWPVALLIAIGALCIWQRRRRALVAVALIALVVPFVHLTLALSLRDRCSPDDASIPGCRHY